ncbi:MAG: Minf_1886 family protein [Chthoniobacterales bacterium]
MSFHEALDLILRDDHRYHKDAYVFVRDALEVALKHRKKNVKEVQRHVSAAELLEAFQHHALKEFGPMTVAVLDYWGVKNTDDVGNIVFNLIHAGILGKTDEDTLEAFRNGFDFQEIFIKPFLPLPRKLDNSVTEGINPLL